jgi:hypothetical protein
VEVGDGVDFYKFIGEMMIADVKNGEVDFRVLMPTRMKVIKGRDIRGYIREDHLMLFDAEIVGALY